MMAKLGLSQQMVNRHPHEFSGGNASGSASRAP
jgi:ABC-type oligopeptide transport system ATPase subunit